MRSGNGHRSYQPTTVVACRHGRTSPRLSRVGLFTILLDLPMHPSCTRWIPIKSIEKPKLSLQYIIGKFELTLPQSRRVERMGRLCPF